MAVAALVPALVIFVTGIVLQFKKVAPWVQPPEHRGTGAVPSVSLETVLEAARSAPEAEIEGWVDVARIDVRPSRGMAKVVGRSGWEVQVDLGTGDVLQAAVRRSDWIESLHDGRFFGGDWSAWGVFVPTGLALTGLAVTGAWLWAAPVVSRRRSRIRRGRMAVERSAGQS